MKPINVYFITDLINSEARARSLFFSASIHRNRETGSSDASIDLATWIGRWPALATIGDYIISPSFLYLTSKILIVLDSYKFAFLFYVKLVDGFIQTKKLIK